MPFLISKILSASSERARRLDNFNKTFSKDLDDMIARQKNEIRQNYSQQFNYELNQAEICAKNGDMLSAMQHKLRAEMMNDFLNTFDLSLCHLFIRGSFAGKEAPAPKR